MKTEDKYQSVVWDLTYAIADANGDYKYDAYGRVMVYDYPEDDCSIVELPEPDKLKWRDDHYDYSFAPNSEIGIILCKEDIDPDNELTENQWRECVSRINRGKFELDYIIEVVQDSCEAIVTEMEATK